MDWMLHMHVLYLRGRPRRLVRDGPGEVRELAHECGQTLDHHDHSRGGPRGGFAIGASHEDAQVGGQVQDARHQHYQHRYGHRPAGSVLHGPHRGRGPPDRAC
eukprot:12195384-Alexandrium_andersonii.AAC.1